MEANNSQSTSDLRPCTHRDDDKSPISVRSTKPSSTKLLKHFQEESAQLQIGFAPNEQTKSLVPLLRRSDPLPIHFPALPGWADVWRSALRALHLLRSLPCHFTLNLPQASRLLGEDQGKGCCLPGVITGDLISLYQEDPRSQKRDLGHPSVFSYTM
jgi:hypothetical protein